MGTYEKCKTIRRLILTRAAEVMNYNWDDKFSTENIKGLVDALQTRIKDGSTLFGIQPSELTKNQMDELDFGTWSKDDPKRLIPLWLFPFLAEDIQTECINDKQYTRKKDMDTDHRFGSLAYGVIPKAE